MLSNFNILIFSVFLMWQPSGFANESGKQAFESVVPVVNQQLKQETISRRGLSAIFKMRLHKWADGTAITVFVLDDEHTLHKTFCKTILNVFPHQMRRIWNRLVFSGSGQAPIKLDSKEEMIKKLSSTTGAIGYLKISDVKEGMKILKIQPGSQY